MLTQPGNKYIQLLYTLTVALTLFILKFIYIIPCSWLLDKPEEWNRAENSHVYDRIIFK